MAAANSIQRMKLLIKNYVEAKKAGELSGYDINLVEPENYEHYYILLKPKSGIYKGQDYIIELKTKYGSNVDRLYPINPPNVKFLSGIFHTNVSSVGSICVDILTQAEQWMPTYNFDAIVQNILLLMDEPNNASPYNSDASRCWVDCQKEMNQKVTRNATVDEIDEIKQECFKPFIEKVKIARTDLLKYVNWFPQLNVTADDYKYKQEEVDKKFKEVEEIHKQLNEKKKKVEKIEEPKPKVNRWAKYQNN
jgi:ubiquitin-protein ligase